MACPAPKTGPLLCSRLAGIRLKQSCLSVLSHQDTTRLTFSFTRPNNKSALMPLFKRRWTTWPLRRTAAPSQPLRSAMSLHCTKTTSLKRSRPFMSDLIPSPLPPRFVTPYLLPLGRELSCKQMPMIWHHAFQEYSYWNDFIEGKDPSLLIMEDHPVRVGALNGFACWLKHPKPVPRKLPIQRACRGYHVASLRQR